MLDKNIIPEFAITYKCNMDCEYCYARVERDNYEEEMKIDTFITILDYLKYAIEFVFGQEMDEITLLGGEPTVHSHLTHLIKKASDEGIKVNLFTNGVYALGLLDPVLSLPNFHALIFHYEPIFLPPKFKNIFHKNIEDAYTSGKRIILRFNTSDDQFDFSDLLELAKEFKTDIAYSFTVPGPGVKNPVPISNLYIFIDRLIKFTDECRKKTIKLLIGRPLPFCMGNPKLLNDIEFWEKLRYLQQYADFQAKCPTLGDLVINPDSSLQLCVATPNSRTQPINNREDASKKLRLLVKYQKRCIRIPSMNECKSCGYFKNGEDKEPECQGGCLGYKGMDKSISTTS